MATCAVQATLQCEHCNTNTQLKAATLSRGIFTEYLNTQASTAPGAKYYLVFNVERPRMGLLECRQLSNVHRYFEHLIRAEAGQDAKVDDLRDGYQLSSYTPGAQRSNPKSVEQCGAALAVATRPGLAGSSVECRCLPAH